MNVVQRGERGKENLAGLKKMPQIRFAEGLAGVTEAGGVERSLIFQILGVFDDNFALRCEKVTVTGVSLGNTQSIMSTPCATYWGSSSGMPTPMT